MLIFISGSINSGKSTIANLLAQKIDRPAVLEIDSLSAMLPNIPIDQKIGINLENAVLLIRNFLKNGFNPIVPYPLSEKNYQFLLEELPEYAESMHFFILNPRLESVLINRGGRELAESEIERIKYHYNAGINNPVFGVAIDNSDMSPNETAEYIMKEIIRN